MCYVHLYGHSGNTSKFKVDVSSYKTIEVDVWTPNSGHIGYVYIDDVQIETFNNSTVKTLTYDVSNASSFEIRSMGDGGFQAIIERIKMY